MTLSSSILLVLRFIAERQDTLERGDSPVQIADAGTQEPQHVPAVWILRIELDDLSITKTIALAGCHG